MKALLAVVVGLGLVGCISNPSENVADAGPVNGNWVDTADSGPCGDGVCDEFESRHPAVCPQDCPGLPATTLDYRFVQHLYDMSPDTEPMGTYLELAPSQTIQEVLDDLAGNACGMTLYIPPGEYNEEVDVTGIDCEGQAPFVLRALYPVVSLWDESVAGAGALSHCVLEGDDCGELPDENCSAYACSEEKVSWVYAIRASGGLDSQVERNLAIMGFETRYISFALGSDDHIKAEDSDGVSDVLPPD